MVVLSALVVLLFIVGLLSKVFDWASTQMLFPLSLLIFGLLWMPLFLFYAYDRKQQRKSDLQKADLQSEDSQWDDSSESQAPAGSLSDIFRNLHLQNPPPSESRKDSEE